MAVFSYVAEEVIGGGRRLTRAAGGWRRLTRAAGGGRRLIRNEALMGCRTVRSAAPHQRFVPHSSRRQPPAARRRSVLEQLPNLPQPQALT